jgi:hypothetical protein
MIPVLDRAQPLYVVANDARQIVEAIDFAKAQNVRMILVGGAEAHRAAAKLVEAGIPVILRNVIERPLRQDDGTTSRALPALLRGRRDVLLSNEGSWQVRKPPLQAGQGRVWTASASRCARSRSTAQMLGVDGELGSLDVGKRDALRPDMTRSTFGAQADVDRRRADLDDQEAASG